MTELNRNNSNWSAEERRKINENWDILESMANSTASGNNGLKQEVDQLKVRVTENTSRVTNSLQVANQANVKSESASEKADRAITISEIVDGKASSAEINSRTALNNSNNALSIANDSKNTSENVQAQFNQVVAEAGSNNPEVVASRTDSQTGEVFVSLNQRLDEQHRQFNKQINQNKAKNFYNPLINHRKQTPSATIIDDDGAEKVWTILRQIAIDYNIPITSAIVPSFVINGNSGGKAFTGPTLTLNQIKTLERDHNFEFVSHTYTHPRLTDLTEQQIDDELRMSQIWLNDNGFDGNTTIVYPYGAENATVRKIARRYYQSAFDTDDGLGTTINVPIANQYSIRRVFDTYGVQKAMTAIDEAVANNGWFVFGTHVWYDTFSESELRQIIEYAISRGVEFITVREGLYRFGNVVDISDGLSSFRIGADGRPNLGLNIESNNAHTVNSVLTDFLLGSVTYTPITYAEAQNPGYPIAQGGILKTFRVSSAAGTFYQEYEGITINNTRGTGKRNIFIRYWIGGAWTAWNFLEDAPLVETYNRHTVLSTPADFDSMSLTYTLITFAEAQNAGYPIKQGGILKTIIGDRGASYTIYQEYEGLTVSTANSTVTRDIFTRYWVNNAWTAWQGVENVLTLNNGWGGTLTCRKDKYNRVSLTGALTVGTTTAGTILTQLPIGHRPKTIAPIVAYNSTKLESQLGLLISNTGNISIRLPGSTTMSSGDTVNINLVFQA